MLVLCLENMMTKLFVLATGRSTWNLLHTMAAYYPDTPTQEVKDDCRIFFEKFAKLYPCKSCADHFREQWVIFSRPGSTKTF